MSDRYFLVIEACLRWIASGYEFNVIEDTLRDYGFDDMQREEIFARVQKELKKRGKKGNAAD